jgi:hypothetical protein
MPTQITGSRYPVIYLTGSLEIQQAANTNQLEILQAVDDPVGQTVKSLVKISTNPYAHNWYTVWSGPTYVAIGNWTDQDLADAVTALVVAEYPPALTRNA